MSCKEIYDSVVCAILRTIRPGGPNTHCITAEHFKSTREIHMRIMRDTIARKAITLQNLNRINEAESALATADFLTTVLDASKQ